MTLKHWRVTTSFDLLVFNNRPGPRLNPPSENVSSEEHFLCCSDKTADCFCFRQDHNLSVLLLRCIYNISLNLVWFPDFKKKVKNRLILKTEKHLDLIKGFDLFDLPGRHLKLTGQPFKWSQAEGSDGDANSPPQHFQADKTHFEDVFLLCKTYLKTGNSKSFKHFKARGSLKTTSNNQY